MISDFRHFLFMSDVDDDFLMHEGTPHEGSIPHSGRYPYGSGEVPYQRMIDIYHKYYNLKAKHPDWSEVELAARCGCVKISGYNKGKPSTTELKRAIAAGKAAEKVARIQEAMRLKEQGLTNVEIGKRMGIPDTTVGNYLKAGRLERESKALVTADALQKFVDQNRYVDIGAGVNLYLNAANQQFSAAVKLLEDKGYKQQIVTVKQQGTDHNTTILTLTPGDVDYQELYENRFNIKSPATADKLVDVNGEVTALGLAAGKPTSIDPSRIAVEYDSPKDGIVELRRGVDDISLGPKNYAQVRIAVDDSHFIKGMAVYRDDMPDGVDLVVCTNKKAGTPLLVKDDPDAKQVLKPMKTIEKDGKPAGIDWDNPFGASIDLDSDIMSTSKEYIGKDGKVHKSAINVVREEGDWMTWDKNLASQYLSKQPIQTAKRQLDMAVLNKKVEFEEIQKLTNPTVKKHLLEAFADKCDSLAVELKAAPFRNQQTHVLLPAPDIPDGEIYAPRYPNGTLVALVRYPFAAYAESPLLRVNNTNSPGEKVIPKSSPDAVCVNKRRLDQMSGADCDGDTAIVIPVGEGVKVRTAADTFEGLKGFDTKAAYPGYEGMPVIKHQTQQNEMGRVTNLITDMSFQNAPEDDLVRAIKYSMVIIDSEKHKLNWQQCYKDMGIADLKRTYQMDEEGHTGAGTIISRAGADKRVPERQNWTLRKDSIDEQGNKIYSYTDNVNKTGKLNLKNVTLKTGETVSLTVDEGSGLYYTKSNPQSKTDPNAAKRIRVYVDDNDLPDRLRGLDIGSGGWVYVNTDKKTKRDYYLQTDLTTGKPVRVYVDDDTFVAVKSTPKLQKSTRMAEVNDAYELTSGGSRDNIKHPMEKVYADFANEMKDLARSARREWARTGDQKYVPEAAKAYKVEVKSINDKLTLAKSNAPVERMAQLMAGRTMEIKKYENPNMTREEQKKKGGQAIVAARTRLNAKKKLIELTESEYKAIEAGAISKTRLLEIMDNTNIDSLRKYATPRQTRSPSSAQKNLIKALKAQNYTLAEIEERVGFSISTINDVLNPST